MPSHNLQESVELLWPRQRDGKRKPQGVYNPESLRLYLEKRMPHYSSGADRILYAYNASKEKVVSTVLRLLIE